MNHVAEKIMVETAEEQPSIPPESESESEGSEEPGPQFSLNGAVLGPGDHLLEVELARPAKPEIFLQALKTMGFVDVLIDQSVLKPVTPEPPEPAPPIVEEMWRRWREWGDPTSGGAPEEGPLRFRFAGRVAEPIRILDTPWVRWIYAQPATVDLFADPSTEPFEPAPLKHGQIYELRFLARLRVQDRCRTRRAICAALTTMRFRPLKITSLRRNIKLPGLYGTNFVLWYGLAQWEGPDSYVSSEDPFFFEVVRAI